MYSDSKNVYVRPEKVWNRYSDTMFLPHLYNRETGSFKPILDGVQASRFYQVLNAHQRPGQQQTTDSWDRFFNRIRLQLDEGEDVTDDISRMCDIMLTRDPRMRKMVKDNFKPEDYFYVRDHMIGTGLIGGKACGMLLARKIIENKDPDLTAILEPHDSFFIGSDVFYTYIVDNNYWDLRIRQRTEEGYFTLAQEFSECLMKGRFSADLEDQFMLLLEYYGQDPIIVRSSSILEDGFGNAFAGKYESVFCANRDSGLHMMLIVPGRIGTSSPELGVPIVFSDISEFEAVCEVAYSAAGYNPELSYGSHMFQDLVESQILYTAIFESQKTVHFHPDMLAVFENLVESVEGGEKLKEIIGLYDLREADCTLLHDLRQQRLVCTLAKKP